MAEGSSEKMTSEITEDEPFKAVPVRRKRKRQQVEDMDTSDESKRPSFPPAKAEKLMVKCRDLISCQLMNGVFQVYKSFDLSTL